VARAQLSALGKDFRTTATVDRAVHTAAEQGRVGRVDHHVDLLRGDVALDDLDLHAASVVFANPLPAQTKNPQVTLFR
jgi:hypothetical protein